MAQEIKLLSTYDGFPPQSIITVSDSIAAQLLPMNATTDLSGGVRRYKEIAPVGAIPFPPAPGPGSVGANQRTTITLPGDYQLNLSGNSSAQGTFAVLDTSGAELSTGVLAPGAATIGPFNDARQVRLIGQAGSVSFSAEFQAFGASVSNYTTPVSQYTKALFFGKPIRQMNAVKGRSLNCNDLQYAQPITATGTQILTDADVYDCEPGLITFGRSYNGGTPVAASAKGLVIPWQKVRWDIDEGQSIMIQARIKTIGQTGNRQLMGNSNGTPVGYGIALQIAGTLLLNYKTTLSAASNINISKVVWDGTNMALRPVTTDGLFNFSIVIDASTRQTVAWIDGIAANINATQSSNDPAIVPGSLIKPGATFDPTSPRNFGIGYIPTDTSFTPSNVTPGAFEALGIYILPAGKKFSNPGRLDAMFNANPFIVFTDADLTNE